MARKKKKSFHEYPAIQYLIPQEFRLGPNPFLFFLDSLSFKHFFSTLFRAINEDPLWHHFDNHLSGFELKIGFGNYQASVTQHDDYYAYAILAHVHGKSYSSLSKLMSYMEMIFVAHVASSCGIPEHALEKFSQCVHIYLSAFLYQWKCMPAGDIREQMQWCIDGFFSLRNCICEMHGLDTISVSKKHTIVGEQLELFMLLFHVSTRLSQEQPYGSGYQAVESYRNIWRQYLDQDLMQAFLTHYHESRSRVFWTTKEYHFASHIVRYDAYHYVLMTKYPSHIGKDFFAQLFSKKALSGVFQSLRMDTSQLFEELTSIMNPLRLRDRFITAARYMAVQQRKSLQVDDDDTLDQFFEAIQDGDVKRIFDIPASLQHESEMMNHMLHFYMYSIMTSFQYFGTKKPTIYTAHSLSPFASSPVFSDEKLIVQSILQQYGSCLFYYKIAYGKIRQGLERFTIPLVPNDPGLIPGPEKIDEIFEVHSMLLFDDVSATSMLVSATSKEIKLFALLYGDRIRHLLSVSNEELLQEIYGSLLGTTTHETMGEHLPFTLRESLYEFDFHLWHEMYGYLIELQEIKTIQLLQLRVISAAIIKQSILGVLIFWSFVDRVSHQYPKRSFLLDILAEILVREVRFLPFASMRKVSAQISHMMQSYQPLLDPLLRSNETEKMCNIGYESLLALIETAEEGKLINIGHEDIVWFREYLKHIHHFSKKLYKPSM